MKNRIQKLMRILPVLVISLAMLSCENVESDSLFDENYQPLPPAVITNLLPENQQLQGFETVTIQGEGFITDPSRIFVYFNEVRATIISASPTELVVRTPNRNGTFNVKVMMLGVEQFSNTLTYRLLPLFRPAITVSSSEIPYGATRDADGNIYVSLTASGAPAGIIKFGPDGERVEPVPFGAVQGWFYNNATIGPDGNIYLVRGGIVPILYRLASTGGTVATFRTGLGRTEDVTFDSAGNAWTAGRNEGVATNAMLNRINPAGTQLQRFPFNADVFALEYLNGYIYIAGTRASVSYIWRVPLNASNEPGAEEVVANLTDLGFVGRPTAIAISGDGTIFIGAHENIPLFEYRTDGTLHTLYDGILQGNILKMEYVPGTDEVLYTSVPFEKSGFTQQVFYLNVQRPAP